MNGFTVLGIEPTTEKKTIKRAYAAKSREFHPEEHPEEFQRIHDAYEEALAWAERNAERGEEPQMPEEPRRMEMGAAEQEKAAESETWNYAEPERNPEEAYMENPQKEDVQSEESSAQYEELPVHSDEDSEESFREEEAGEPPVQLEEDSQTWDGDWTRQFQNMADASERQGADDREVRKIMEQCISLYLNEKERNKLYHWKDILEEPAYREYFRTKTFVESWYHFLDTHRMFDAAIWQYFQWIDGKLFSALEADVMPFAYPTQEEIERMPRQETPEQTQERRTPEPGPALPKVKKEKSKAVKVLLYLAALAGTGIGGMILGIIAGTILGSGGRKMKKKKSGKRIFAIVLLVVIGIGGFYFGYDIGRMDHDEERIRAELKKTTADSEISIRPVAKGGTGKTEIEILTECLEDAKDSLENLEKYNEQLQALDGKTPDTETVVLIQDLDDKNEKAYEVLKDLAEDPAGYIAEKAAARGEGDEVWADDWAADIQVVKWLKENDGKRLYKENQAYILKILAFQKK